MASLEEQIKDDLKTAMKAKNADEVSVLRMVQASLRNQAIAKKGELTDDDVTKLLSSAIKQRKDSAESFRQGGREESAVKEEEEITVLKRYLPEELSEDAVRAIVQEVVAETGASSSGDMGKVMGPVMKKVQGRADGSFIKQLVEEALSN
ncbi:MAG: GatB/YqeY domain-containing protein [Candidatus Doudnabacteria bacterium]|nr:GatB/YqeY domain-containing protein [Candidatus Doudnabacteria bacterium]